MLSFTDALMLVSTAQLGLLNIVAFLDWASIVLWNRWKYKRSIVHSALLCVQPLDLGGISIDVDFRVRIALILILPARVLKIVMRPHLSLPCPFHAHILSTLRIGVHQLRRNAILSIPNQPCLAQLSILQSPLDTRNSNYTIFLIILSINLPLDHFELHFLAIAILISSWQTPIVRVSFPVHLLIGFPVGLNPYKGVKGLALGSWAD